MNSPACL
jgi:hypothetical protein